MFEMDPSVPGKQKLCQGEDCLMFSGCARRNVICESASSRSAQSYVNPFHFYLNCRSLIKSAANSISQSIDQQQSNLIRSLQHVKRVTSGVHPL